MNTKETKRVIENRLTSYDLIMNEMETDEVKTAVSKTLGILYTEQGVNPSADGIVPIHIGVYFYCMEEEYEFRGEKTKEDTIFIRQSFWQDGNLVNDTTMKMDSFSAIREMGMKSYEELKAYFLEHFSDKMAFYKLMRFFIRNDISFGCDDEELVEEFEEDILGYSGPDPVLLKEAEDLDKEKNK